MFTTCMHFLSHFWFFFFFFVPISSVDPNFDVGGCKSKPECMKFWIVLQQCEDLKCHFSILVVQGVDQRCLLLVCISLSAFLRFEALWKTWIRPAIFPFRKNVCCWCALFVIFFFWWTVFCLSWFWFWLMFSLPLGIRVCWPWSTLSSDLPSSSTYCWWGVFVSSMVGSSFGQKCLLLVCIVCLFFLFIMILIFIFCSSEERFCEALPTLEHPIFHVGIWKLKLPGMFEIWICPRTEIGRRDENFWTSYQHFFFCAESCFLLVSIFLPFFFEFKALWTTLFSFFRI